MADNPGRLTRSPAQRQTVLVAFEVFADDGYEAEAVVRERLAALPVLWQNDSTDALNNTLDPINTYAVVPQTRLLDEAL